MSKRDDGFTLVELIVALAVFGLIAAASVALLSGTVRLQESHQRHFRQMEGVGRMTTLLGQELAQAGTGTGFTAGARGSGAVIGWTRIGPPLGRERVTLELRGTDLVRRGSGAEELLLGGVRSIAVRTREQGAWSEGWSPTRPDALPDAVELSISADGQPPLRLAFLVGVPR